MRWQPPPRPVALNGALLFVVLFFVFPLKFILGWIVNRLLGGAKLEGLEGETGAGFQS